jgi:hypothetical protein
MADTPAPVGKVRCVCERCGHVFWWSVPNEGDRQAVPRRCFLHRTRRSNGGKSSIGVVTRYAPRW